jgi:hypothetical protein
LWFEFLAMYKCVLTISLHLFRVQVMLLLFYLSSVDYNELVQC